MVNVAYICADPGIAVFGTKGASIHIQEVMRALLNRGEDITLFAQRIGDGIPEEFGNLTINALPKLPKTTDAVLRARAALETNGALIEQLHASQPYDVVYERYSLWSHAGMTFARQARITSILEVNAPLIEEQKQYRELPLENEALAVLRQALTNADVIIAVSPGVKDYLDSFAEAQGRVHVVANGVDPKRFQNTKPASRAEPVIGFVGTLKPWHGVQSLLDAFALLRQRGTRARLSIVGDGPEFGNIHQWLENRDLLPYTDFSGAVEPSLIPHFLAKMDIGVAPYPELQNFYFSPLKIYEYMAAGLPVITTCVGHLPDIITHEKTGLLVPPDDPQALSAALERLLDDDALRLSLGQAGRTEVERSHSWQNVVNHIWHLADLSASLVAQGEKTS